MPFSRAYRRNALVVEHYTSGSGHSSAAHVVGGFKYRIIRTSLIHLSLLSVVTLDSLSAHYTEDRNLTSSQLRSVHLSRWTARCISSLIFGILLDHSHHHTGLLAALCMVLTAIAALVTAFSEDFYMVMAAAVLLGICNGAVYMCCLINTLKLWNKQSHSAIHSLYAMSSIGNLSSFLFYTKFGEDSTFIDSNLNNTTDPNLYNTTSIGMSDLGTDFFEFQLFCVIIALFCIVLVVICVILYCYERFKIHSFSGEVIHRIKPYEGRARNSVSCSLLGKCTGGRPAYGLIFALLLFIIFFTTFSSKLSIFPTEKCSNQNESYSPMMPRLITLCSYTVSLILSSAYSHYIAPHYVMYVNLCGHFFCSLFFVACQQSHAIAAHLMHGLHAFTLAVIIPSFISWSHLYIEVNGVILGIGATGESTAPIIIFYILDTLPKKSIIMKLIPFGCSFVSIVVFIILFLTATKQGQRADSQNELVVTDNEDEKPSSPKAVSFSE